MPCRREEERTARVERLFDRLGCCIRPNPEGFKDVGAAALTRDGAIAVLRDPDARTGNDEEGCAGDGEENCADRAIARLPDQDLVDTLSAFTSRRN